MGLEGLWVDDGSVRPHHNFIFDGCPDGFHDAGVVSAMLATWPRDESFCFEVRMIRKPEYAHPQRWLSAAMTGPPGCYL